MVDREYVVKNHDTYQKFKLNDNANDILKKGCSLLVDMAVPYWLSGGTALGIYRDKGFIKDDTDIDVEVIGNRKVNHIFNNFSIEFELVREVTDNYGFTYQQAFYHIPTEILFDIFYYRETNDKLVGWSETSGEITYPKEFLRKINPIEFNNVKYPIIEPETYLEWIYGKCWKTPIQKDKVIYSWGKDEHTD